jgi:anti-sigma factor RsiW
MTCREIADFLMDYLDGELPAATRATFEAHLRACRDCRNYLEGYRQTGAASKAAMTQPSLDVAEMPDGLITAILAAGRDGRS